jgi:hypothetical protein
MAISPRPLNQLANSFAKGCKLVVAATGGGNRVAATAAATSYLRVYEEAFNQFGISVANSASPLRIMRDQLPTMEAVSPSK